MFRSATVSRLVASLCLLLLGLHAGGCASMSAELPASMESGNIGLLTSAGEAALESGNTPVGVTQFVADVKAAAAEDGFEVEHDLPGAVMLRRRGEALGCDTRMAVYHKPDARGGRLFTVAGRSSGYFNNVTNARYRVERFRDRYKARSAIARFVSDPAPVASRAPIVPAVPALPPDLSTGLPAYSGLGSLDGYGGGYGGGDVYVRGYTRKDGTYVRSHTRSRPGSGSRSRGSSRR